MLTPQNQMTDMGGRTDAMLEAGMRSLELLLELHNRSMAYLVTKMTAEDELDQDYVVNDHTLVAVRNLTHAVGDMQAIVTNFRNPVWHTNQSKINDILGG